MQRNISAQVDYTATLGRQLSSMGGSVPTIAKSRNGEIKLEYIRQSKDFQTRQGDLELSHLRQLTAVVSGGRTLSRILVWQDVSAEDDSIFTLLDGRYRFEAYRRAGWQGSVPVKIVRCTKRDAMLCATVDAIKDRLNLTQSEKTDRAWRLVRDEECRFSKSEVSKATGVGTATVGRMRRRLAEMKQAGDVPTGYWWRDREEAHEDDGSEGARRELTAKERKALVAKLVPQVRDVLDWRRWNPAIPDEALQFEIVSAVFGERKLFHMLEWSLGGDKEKTSAIIDQWNEDYAYDDEFSNQEDEDCGF